MFLALVSVTSLALFVFPASSNDGDSNNVSATDWKIQRRNYSTDLENQKLPDIVASGRKGIRTGMISFLKDVLKTKERKNEDNKSSHNASNGSNNIIGSVVDFMKTTGKFISKVFNCIKYENNIETNKTVDNLLHSPRQVVNTTELNQSESRQINSRHAYDNKSNIFIKSSLTRQPHNAALSKEVRYKLFYNDDTVHSTSNKTNGRKENFVQFKSKTVPLKHSSSTSENMEKCFEDEQIYDSVHIFHNKSYFKKKNYLLVQPTKTKNDQSTNSVSSIKEQINILKNSPRKYEFSVQNTANLQSNSIQDKLTEETTSEQKDKIRFMTHSEEFQKLWKPVLKMNEEKRQERLEKKYLSRATSRDKFFTHSEEYRTKWQPLIVLNNHLKPGRRLRPGRIYMWTTEKSVNHKGMGELVVEKLSDQIQTDNNVSEKCTVDVLNTSVNSGSGAAENATLHLFVTTSKQKTLLADESTLENNKNSSFVGKVDRKASDKERRKSEDDLLSSLSAEAFKPWAENRFQRVSNNIGLDQHFKSSGSKWGRAVSRLTARPNNSRATYDKMFP